MLNPKHPDYAAAFALTVTGLVALMALWVVNNSNCGTAFSFHLLP
ncbi:hypothetical protein [Anabaena sp. CCY 9910]